MSSLSACTFLWKTALLGPVLGKLLVNMRTRCRTEGKKIQKMSRMQRKSTLLAPGKGRSLKTLLLLFYFFMGYVHPDFSVKIETACVLSWAFRVLRCFKARKSHLHFPHTSGLVRVE